MGGVDQRGHYVTRHDSLNESMKTIRVLIAAFLVVSMGPPMLAQAHGGG